MLKPFSVLRTLVWSLQKVGTGVEACGAIVEQRSHQSGQDRLYSLSGS